MHAFGIINIPMPQAILPIRAFIALSWKRYTEHLGRFLEVSLWMLFPALLQLVTLFLFTSSWTSLDLRSVWTANLIVIRVIELVFLTWVQARLIMLALSRDPKQEGYIATHPHIGWKLVAPLLFVNILTSLGVLGGGVLFVLPGIWLFFALLFAGFAVVDEDLRGFAALEASFALVKHRFWPVVWRTVIATLSFFGIMFLVSFCFTLIFSVIFGGETSRAVGDLTRNLLLERQLSVDTMRAYAITGVQNSLVMSIVTPFLVAAQAVLYRSLQDTFHESRR